MGENDTFSDWSASARDLLGQAINVWGSVELAKAQRNAISNPLYDNVTGQYYLPGQRYSVTPGQAVQGVSNGALLLIGGVVIAAVLLMR